MCEKRNYCLTCHNASDAIDCEDNGVMVACHQPNVRILVLKFCRNYHIDSSQIVHILWQLSETLVTLLTTCISIYKYYYILY